MSTQSVLFVCLGNICRSPTAEGVFRHFVRQQQLQSSILHDSCGTAGYHIGAPPDHRAVAHARQRGYVIDDLRARQVSVEDFQRFDLILAADRDNLRNLRALCPPAHHGKLQLMLDFSSRYRGQDVPDPYYGGASGFEQVLDMLEDMTHGLLRHLQR